MSAYTRMVPANVFQNANVSVGTTATAVLAVNLQRTYAVVKNLSTNTAVYVGTSGVTQTNGYQIPTSGGTVEVHIADSLYGIVASGTADVRVIEEV